jgi:hypothetical protein
MTAVADGGGDCGFENFQTICIFCHKELTAEQRRRTWEDRIDAEFDYAEFAENEKEEIENRITRLRDAQSESIVSCNHSLRRTS